MSWLGQGSGPVEEIGFLTRLGHAARGRSRGRSLFAGLAAATLYLLPAQAGEDLAGDWIEGHKNRARILAGTVEGAPAGRVLAFVEIAMDKGWKTYWRNPGTAGGIPPVFDWSKSKNVAALDVLYPVPQVMSDKAGDVIGYKEHVIFPLRITAKDASQPIGLDVLASYGICETLCVPAEAPLTLDIPSGALPEASADAAAAFQRVPRVASEMRPDDPGDLTVARRADGAGLRLTLSARFPGAADAAAVFLDAGDGRYLPLPTRAGVEGDRVRFEVSVPDASDAAALKGASVIAVLKGEKGQSEHAFVID